MKTFQIFCFIDLDETDLETKTFGSSAAKIFLDYTVHSTIQGLIYLFISYQTKFGKAFWSLVLILMLTLGLYWCAQAYYNWSAQPAFTTIKSAEMPVEQVHLDIKIFFGIELLICNF